MYGGIFAGPALEQDNTPVVRYQDLHRSHAPASAGVPELGSSALVGASSGFGDVSFGAMPSYGGSEYGRTLTVTDTDGYEYEVDTSSSPKRVTITKSPRGSVPRDVPPSSTTAYNAILAKAKEQYPYDFLSTSSGGSTSSTPSSRGGTTKKDEDKDDGTDWEDFFRAAAGGLVKGLKNDTKKDFEPSGKDSRPVDDKQDKKEESKVGTYLLVGGASLLGIGILAAVISASRRRGEE